LVSVFSEERDNVILRKIISHLLNLPFQNEFWGWSEFHLYPQQLPHHFSANRKKGQVSCFLLGINYQDWRVLWNKDMFTIYLFTLPTQESKVFQKFIFIIKVYSFCIRFYWGITANFNIKYFCWNLQDDEKTAVTVNYRKYESVWQWKKWV